MNFKVIDVAQRSPEWKQARAGRLTASRAGHAISFRKDGKESASRRDYRIELVAERLTGQPCESSVRMNADIERGIELEPAAVAAYEIESGNFISRVGFVAHDDILAGYSPDGVIREFEGLIEVKCPRPANHLEYCDGGRVPIDHIDQCRHALWLTGAEWIDFVSYSPVFPSNLQLFICRLHRQDADVDGYAKAAALFLEEVAQKESALRGWSAMREAVTA